MGYVSLSQREEKADDQTVQIGRMYDLIEQSEKGLKHVVSTLDMYNDKKDLEGFEGITKKEAKDPLRYIDSNIWKVEIDIESVNDV